jgi:hypothetical protein
VCYADFEKTTNTLFFATSKTPLLKTRIARGPPLTMPLAVEAFKRTKKQTYSIKIGTKKYVAATIKREFQTLLSLIKKEKNNPIIKEKVRSFKIDANVNAN